MGDLSRYDAIFIVSATTAARTARPTTGGARYASAVNRGREYTAKPWPGRTSALQPTRVTDRRSGAVWSDDPFFITQRDW